MGHLIALATTLVVEGLGMAAAASLLRGWRPHWRCAVALAIGLNLISHTIFWYALPYAVPLHPDAILFAEIVVAVAEGAVYAATVAHPFWSAWPVSFALNWASWVLGSYVWRFA